MDSKPNSKPNPLESTFQAQLSSRQARSLRRQLSLPPANAIDFSSNDYLSLSRDPALHAALLAELSKPQLPSSSPPSPPRSSPSTPSPPLPPSPQHPTPLPLGSTGSRLLSGNSPYVLALESAIAAFHHAPTALLFTSGYDANAGLVSSAPQRGDVVLHDALVHASVHDGMRLSRAGRCEAFAHNDVAALRRALRGLVGAGGGGESKAGWEGAREGEGDEMVGRGERNVFVVVESVYSMDGDVAPLAAIVEAVEELLPAGNGYVIVDEAHSTGLFGERGNGLVCELGLEDRVFARVHTFGKALACSGAAVLCSHLTREYLINYARSLIYTTAMSFPSLANIKVMYDFMMQGRTEPLRQNLRSLSNLFHERLLALCASCSPELLHVAPDPPRSPIVALLTSRPRSLAQHCQRHGFVVRPIVAPTVPAGTERVRICLHAGNTSVQIVGLVEAIENWVKANQGASDKSAQEKARL